MTKKQSSSKSKAPTVIPTDPNALKKLKLSLGLIIAAFAFILYAQSIAYDYTLDDHGITDKNDLVKKGITAIPKLLSTDYLFGYNKGELSGPVYRPTSLIMFAIEWNLFGNNPHIFHFMNVLLYAITCLVLYLLLCKLFEKQNLIFPFICTLLYATHPIHTEVVNNIKSRDEILCFLFGILSIYFAIIAVSKKFNLYICLSAICLFLSALSKETGVTFLIIVPLTVFVFRDAPIKKLITVSVIALLVSGFYFVCRGYVLQNIRLNTSDTFLYDSVVAAPNFIARQATVFYILLRYLILLLVPINLTCDYNYSMIKIHTLSDTTAIIAILINAGLGIYALLNIKKKSIISYGILYYFITLSPVSNMFIYNGATMAERFMYTPSLGFCIVLSFFLLKLLKKGRVVNKVQDFVKMISLNSFMFILLSILICLYSIRTFSRCMDWKDNYSIFLHDSEVSENSATVHSLLGQEILKNIYPKENDSVQKSKYIDKAISEFKKSLSIYDINRDTYIYLAICYSTKHDYENVISIYNTFRSYGNDFDTYDLNNLSEAFYNLGSQSLQQKLFDKSISLDDSAIKYNPHFTGSYINKGVAYLNKSDTKNALANFENAIQIDTNSEIAYLNIGCIYSSLKQYEKAFFYLERASKIAPNDYQPLYYIGSAYQSMGNVEKAKQYLEKANILQASQQK